MRKLAPGLAVAIASLAISHTAAAQEGDRGQWSSDIFTFRPKPCEDLQCEGRARAEREYADGWAEIDLFGLGAGSVHIDDETGLYINPRGCVVTNDADVETEAHNERLKELIAALGPPVRARGILERLDRTRSLIKKKTAFSWTPVKWADGEAEPVPARVGPFEVVAEVVPNPAGVQVVRDMRALGIDFKEKVSRVRIQRGDDIVVTVWEKRGRPLAAVFLPDLEVLIIKEAARPDHLTVVDTRHKRVMLRHYGLLDVLENLRAKAKTESAEQPDRYADLR